MSWQTTFLRLSACLFGYAAFFHLWHILVPLAGDPSGAVRHGIFVGINLMCAWCLWRQPPLFKYVFGVLVLQQIYSHGGSAWRAWADQQELDVPSLIIVFLLPATWAVLWSQRPPATDTE